MTIDQLKSKLTVAKIQYNHAALKEDVHRVVFFGKRIKDLSAKIAKLEAENA